MLALDARAENFVTCRLRVLVPGVSLHGIQGIVIDTVVKEHSERHPRGLFVGILRILGVYKEPEHRRSFSFVMLPLFSQDCKNRIFLGRIKSRLMSRPLPLGFRLFLLKYIN